MKNNKWIQQKVFKNSILRSALKIRRMECLIKMQNLQSSSLYENNKNKYEAKKVLQKLPRENCGICKIINCYLILFLIFRLITFSVSSSDFVRGNIVGSL